MANEKKEQQSITVEELVPYIEKQGRKLIQYCNDQRKKYGDRYNRKNKIEDMYNRFGNPAYKPQIFADEYFLILQKKSNLPAAFRDVIKSIGDAAFMDCYFDRRKAMK